MPSGLLFQTSLQYMKNENGIIVSFVIANLLSLIVFSAQNGKPGKRFAVLRYFMVLIVVIISKSILF